MEAVWIGRGTWDEAISSQICNFAPFHINVGFIDEEDGVPLLRTCKIEIEACFGSRRLGANITNGQREKWTLGVCSDAFCSGQYASVGELGYLCRNYPLCMFCQLQACRAARKSYRHLSRLRSRPPKVCGPLDCCGRLQSGSSLPMLWSAAFVLLPRLECLSSSYRRWDQKSFLLQGNLPANALLASLLWRFHPL